MKKNLDKLKIQYKKLGDEIESLQNKEAEEPWYKILASKWKGTREGENKQVYTAYSIFYVLASELKFAKDYTILQTYVNKDQMLFDIKNRN